MNRHRAYWPLDDAPQADGDGFFQGVDARRDPSQLPVGMVAHAVNCRFDEGRAATRKGIRILPWGARGVQGADAALVLPYSDPLLAEPFLDPYGIERLVIITASTSYATQPGSTGAELPGQAPTFASDLVQTYDGLVLLRGADADPLYMPDVSQGWLVLPTADVGKEAIPKATQGLYLQNRLFVVDARTASQYIDTVWVSDIGGVSSVLQGDTTYQSFRINTGSSDRLVGIAKYNETTIIAAKASSIYAVTNIWGTNAQLAENAVLTQITREYGCIAPRTFVQVGKDLWFLGNRRGICSIGQTETNSMQGVDVPISRDIQPIIDRINWEYASAARAEAHDNHVYFAVPLDGAMVNNAVLVYSTLTQRWAGYDLSDRTNVLDFVKFTYAGAIRLGFLSSDGFLCLYEDGYYDQTGDAEGNITNNHITSLVRTRGYGGGSAGYKRYFRCTGRLASWFGQYSVSTVPNGYNEQRVLVSRTKDNTRYHRPHGEPAWDDSNINGDWDQPYREDYSADMDGTQVTDGDSQGTMAYDVLQETDEGWSVPVTGASSVQMELESTRGRLEVIGITMDTRRGQTESTVKA